MNDLVEAGSVAGQFLHFLPVATSPQIEEARVYEIVSNLFMTKTANPF